MPAGSPPRAWPSVIICVRARGLRRDLAVAAAALTVLRRLPAESGRDRLEIESDCTAKDLESHLR
ncbi:hypothetical protein [Nocardia brasiliensis]|uniref:hypothetical protein n=1 Tax=Nocardia brasiliensis TaxID=37326 RepID=UPI003D8D69A3